MRYPPRSLSATRRVQGPGRAPGATGRAQAQPSFGQLAGAIGAGVVSARPKLYRRPVAGLYLALADLVVAVHVGYLAVLVFGGWAACRWRWLLKLHLVVVAWAAGAVTLRYDCPLTSLEEQLRRRAGQVPAPEGFLRHYVRGVVFPERLTPLVVAAMAAVVATGWVGLARRRWAPQPGGGRRSTTSGYSSPGR